MHIRYEDVHNVNVANSPIPLVNLYHSLLKRSPHVSCTIYTRGGDSIDI